MGRTFKPRELAVTVFGLGWLPVAPGTWCSAGCSVIYLALRLLPRWMVLTACGGLFTLSAAAGFWLGHWAIEYYGEPDPSPFVLDEAAGFWLTAVLFWHSAPLFAAAAILMTFRFFDILKPLPLRRLEKKGGGTGIMVDDLAASLYAAGLLWLIRFVVL